MQKLLGLLIGVSAVCVALAAPMCDVKSGPSTTALVELYTSEGCSSCPPADRQLGRLPSRELPMDKAVPLALHVDYWDYIGWRDPYAREAFDARQHWLVSSSRQSTVYTPQFFVSGNEAGDGLADQVNRINRQAARASLALQAGIARSGVLAVEAQASTAQLSQPLAMFVAITEDGLVSQVRAGENKGETLTHDHVVREWLGPFPLTNGTVSIRRDVPLNDGWNAARLDVAAFVQNTVSGEVLQAISTSHCGAAARSGRD